MFDLKEIKAVVQQISETRQLSEDILWSAIEAAFAAAYKREYAKSDQVIRARINRETGKSEFFQVKQVLNQEGIIPEGELSEGDDTDTRVRFNPERHIMIQDAQLVRQGVEAGEDIMFPLEVKTDFSRIAAQSARQAVIQKINEAERQAVVTEFEGKEHTLVHGHVQRVERGNIYVDLGRTLAVLPFAEQIRGERFRQGDQIRAYVHSIDTTRKTTGFVRLSRACPEFVVKLFESEVPELTDGVLEVKAVAREAGTRTKIAIKSSDPSVDPVGSLVGQRGMRVMTVRSEIGSEQIDIISWTDNITDFITEVLLPAEVVESSIDEKSGTASVRVTNEQIPVAIGRNNQNVRLAAKIADRIIVLIDSNEDEIAKAYPDGTVDILKQKEVEKDVEERVEERDAEQVEKESAEQVEESEQKDVQ